MRTVIGYNGRSPVYRDDGPASPVVQESSGGDFVRGGDGPMEVQRQAQRKHMARLRAVKTASKVAESV